ncbi:hypothetical protein [Pontixanthobacter sp.]|uniref:hypothetical protein n=1 Tax=Pontixanthobacter sp. TaxID=2792078 RepID=UPI003C7A6AF5
MSVFLFALVAVILTSLGGRDQVLAAHLSAQQGARVGVLVTGSMIAIITAAVAALSGQYIAGVMPGAGKMMLVAFALLAASIELAWPVDVKQPSEPTHSLGALAIVMLARQIGDGSRFLIFALAVFGAAPGYAAAGGALGGILVIGAGWAMADDLQAIFPLKLMRRILAAIILLVGLYVGLSARGIIS